MKIKNKITATVVIFMLIAGCLGACTPQDQEPITPVTVEYTPDFASVFSNPERGFHNRYEIINDKKLNPYFDSGAADRSFSRAKAYGNTIIHSYLHLDNYWETDELPQELLDNLGAGLDAIRDAGMKIVFRPAYTWEKSPQTPEERILKHIEQINAVISEHSDVIMHLEAGYLGPWGEWHSAMYTSPTVEDNAASRHRIIRKILETTPDNIPIVIRYGFAIQEMLYKTPEGEEPLTQEQKDRIGYHNDSFLAGYEDCGSYWDSGWWGAAPARPSIAQQRQWVYDMETSKGFNVMFGGETQVMNVDDWDDAKGVRVQDEMNLLNCTEINEDYAKNHIDIWKNADLEAEGKDPAETAYTRVKRKMGYRLRLESATYDSAAVRGQEFNFSAVIDNDGYAGLVKQRPIFLVFEKEGGSVFEAVELSDVEVREWVGGDIYKGSYNVSPAAVTVPKKLKKGEYTIGLWLPDLAENLRDRPEYSVRFANEDMWNPEKGYNELGTIEVR